MIGVNTAVMDVELLNPYQGITAVAAHRHYIARVVCYYALLFLFLPLPPPLPLSLPPSSSLLSLSPASPPFSPLLRIIFVKNFEIKCIRAGWNRELFPCFRSFLVFLVFREIYSAPLEIN
jgi:hypothetical protein